MSAGLVVVLLLCASTGVAVAARWTVDERGSCVREWTPSSLVRGPLAMVNALTFPGRELVGGGQAALRDPARSAVGRAILVPTMGLLGFLTGVAQSL